MSNDGLTRSFWTIPWAAHMTLRKASLQRILLEHDGTIIAAGDLWRIKSRPIGPGIYDVFLERAEPLPEGDPRA